MRRIGRVCLAALLAAAVSVPAASAKELKPKFGNIDGVYYTDVSENREACRQAIRAKIALCRQNTNFESNTKNRKYAGCLPIFRRQAQSCTVHFRHQMSKCDLSGAARITDFTGFSCEVTKTVVEDSGPGISPLDERMKARTGSNLRAGPGTNHRVVGSLRTGQEVQVTGRAGDWLRIAAPGGGTAFVHGSLMVAMAERRQKPQTRSSPAAGPSPKCRGTGESTKCWKELANKPGCYTFRSYYHSEVTLTWSGACAGGVAVGRGRIGLKYPGGSSEETGTLVRGKMHGRWVWRRPAKNWCLILQYSHGKQTSDKPC